MTDDSVWGYMWAKRLMPALQSITKVEFFTFRLQTLLIDHLFEYVVGISSLDDTKNK